MRAPDPDALAVAYRGLARKCAARAARRCPRADFDDLEQEAWLGVLLAARSYDPARGSFELIATVAADQYALRHVRTFVLRAGLIGCGKDIRLGLMHPPQGHEIADDRTTSDPEPTADLWALVERELEPVVRGWTLSRYRDGESWATIARRAGTSRQHVEQTCRRALAGLRDTGE